MLCQSIYARWASRNATSTPEWLYQPVTNRKLCKFPLLHTSPTNVMVNIFQFVNSVILYWFLFACLWWLMRWESFQIFMGHLDRSHFYSQYFLTFSSVSLVLLDVYIFSLFYESVFSITFLIFMIFLFCITSTTLFFIIFFLLFDVEIMWVMNVTLSIFS